jgi:hypothetical protein
MGRGRSIYAPTSLASTVLYSERAQRERITDRSMDLTDLSFLYIDFTGSNEASVGEKRKTLGSGLCVHRLRPRRAYTL